VAKYLNFGRPWRTWRLNRKVQGQPVALTKKPVTNLSFPLTAEQAAVKALTIRLYSAKRQGLRLKLNGKKLRMAKLSSGWQTVTAEVPARTTHPGENKLEMTWAVTGRIEGQRTSAAVKWVHLGAAAPQTEDLLAWPIKDGALYLPRGGGLAVYVHPYKGSKLRLKLTAQAAGQRCKLKVRALSDKGTLLKTTREETGLAPGATAETFVDLARVNGKTVRLELLAEGTSCTALALREASIVLPGPRPKVKRGQAPENVLFWMVDNARADRYRAYNPATRVETPVFDQLVKTGTLFQNAYIQGTESRVSHGSLWTGLYPKQARFIDPKNKLNHGWDTIAEGARDAGLLTAAWIANGFISHFWGFSQGFKMFRNTLHKGGGLNAEALADHAIKFINQHGDQRFYLYIGTIDPHVSWRARKPWIDKYYPQPYKGLYRRVVWGKDVERMAGGKRKVSARDRKRIIAIYDSTVSYNDHHLGRVLKALQDKGLRDKTMVVMTADHGEELWDFGRIGHGHSCRHNLVAVPLLIHYPPLFGKGVRVTEGVDVLSVMPTILDALGQPIPERVQGESLLPLAQGVGRGYPRPSIATQYELAHTIKLERWKLRVGGKGTPRLFDMASKDREHKDVVALHPGPRRWLTDALSTFLIYQSRWRSQRWGVASNHKGTFPADMESGKPPPPIRPYVK
jgi:arylsulfatase A-like enzyme